MKKQKQAEEQINVITDVLERYFWDKEKGYEMVERTYMNKDKVVDVQIEKHRQVDFILGGGSVRIAPLIIQFTS